MPEPQLFAKRRRVLPTATNRALWAMVALWVAACMVAVTWLLLT